MLPNRHRLRSTADFAQVVRNGGKCGNKYLVVHHLTGQGENRSPLVGFVVPKKAIPKAVDRNRIKRQLRHICATEIAWFPENTITVIRVLKEAKAQNSELLRKALYKNLVRAQEKMKNA